MTVTQMSAIKAPTNRISILAGLLTGVALSLAAAAGHAENAVIENAVANRGELSEFNLALHKTGVIDELNGSSYTVFAPNNAAFAKLTRAQYPCLYSPECTEEVAEILRNHIVPNEVHVSDAVRGDATFSIDKKNLHLHQPRKNHYTVEGKKILSQNQLAGSMLYVIDGVIADKEELADLRELPPQPLVVLTPKTTTRETVTKEYRYRPDGQPAASAQSTTVIRTTDYPTIDGETPVVRY